MEQYKPRRGEVLAQDFEAAKVVVVTDPEDYLAWLQTGQRDMMNVNSGLSAFTIHEYTIWAGPTLLLELQRSA